MLLIHGADFMPYTHICHILLALFVDDWTYICAVLYACFVGFSVVLMRFI
jgi:hypothetical protein